MQKHFMLDSSSKQAFTHVILSLLFLRVFLLLFSVEFCVLFTNSILKLYSGFVLVCSSGWQQLCRRRIRGDRIISASCYQVQNEEAERCSGDCRQPCKTDQKVRKVQLIWGGDTQGIHCPAFFFCPVDKKMHKDLHSSVQCFSLILLLILSLQRLFKNLNSFWTVRHEVKVFHLVCIELFYGISIWFIFRHTLSNTCSTQSSL